jgi:hypothetical protein
MSPKGEWRESKDLCLAFLLLGGSTSLQAGEPPSPKILVIVSKRRSAKRDQSASKDLLLTFNVKRET